jgi:hypothetical protein
MRRGSHTFSKDNAARELASWGQRQSPRASPIVSDPYRAYVYVFHSLSASSSKSFTRAERP